MYGYARIFVYARVPGFQPTRKSRPHCTMILHFERIFFGFRFICVRQKESLSTTACLLSTRSNLSSWSPSGVDVEKQQGAFIRSFVHWEPKLYNVTSQNTNIVLSVCNRWLLLNSFCRKSCIKLYQIACTTDGQKSNSQCIYSSQSWSHLIILTSHCYAA